MPGVTLQTDRLLLRPWRDDDLESFARLNGDRAVMEHFPATLSRAESDALATRARDLLDERGWGWWALEVVGGDPFIGFTGLAEPTFEADFTPCVEVGWRLAAEHWGAGYAPEAARAALQYGFGELGLDRIVSFTWIGNDRSRRVMEKIGLVEQYEFDHPGLPGHRLERHVLYAAGPTVP